jgi:hypothetical protein
MVVRREIILYACKIKETTNGRRRCACSEARQEVKVVAEGGVKPDGKLNERKRITKNGKDEAQGKAHAQSQEKIGLLFRRLHGCPELKATL